MYSDDLSKTAGRSWLREAEEERPMSNSDDDEYLKVSVNILAVLRPNIFFLRNVLLRI